MKKRVYASMILFWSVFALIVLTHVVTGTAGLHLDYSISKYVGLTFPSAIVFLITNVIVATLMWQYICPKLKSNAQRFLIKYTFVMLVLLSIFPIGLFDTIIPEPVFLGRTPISFLHVITSRTMFVAMAAFALLTFYEGKKKDLHSVVVQKASLAFFIFSAICIFAFVFFSGFFWQFDIIFESLYIAFFFLLVYTF
jgi:hypothetical protein